MNGVVKNRTDLVRVVQSHAEPLGVELKVDRSLWGPEQELRFYRGEDVFDLPHNRWFKRSESVILEAIREIAGLNGNGNANGAGGPVSVEVVPDGTETVEAPEDGTGQNEAVLEVSEGGSLVDEAARLGELGYRVFTVHPKDKRPLESGWQHSASTDEKRIRGAWRVHPGARVGIVPDGFTVIDVDPRNGGVEPEGLPSDAPRVRTAGGGLHVYIAGDVRAKFGPGVDVKRAGGFVVAPPSPGYEWLSGPVAVAELPEAPDLVQVEPLPEVDPASLLAPSIDGLRKLVKSIPNDERFEDRDSYVTMLHAIYGASGGPEGAQVALEWAARWQGGDNDPHVVLRDYETIASSRVGWDWLQKQVPPPSAQDEFVADPDAAKAQAALPARSDIPNLPAEFWNARPALQHIRQAAHARMCGADALLGALLAHVAARVPHYATLDTNIGTPASTNQCVGLISASGIGKSIADGLAERTLPPVGDDICPKRGIGSGEGMIELYHDSKQIGKRVERYQARHNALFVADEGSVLAAMKKRSGTTLGEVIRSASQGKHVGQQNAEKGRCRDLPAGSYSLGLLVALQPETALELLNDTETGTAQRFLWFSATDPTAPKQPPTWPGPLEDVPLLVGGDAQSEFEADPSNTPDLEDEGPDDYNDVQAAVQSLAVSPWTIDQAILDEIRDSRWQRLTGGTLESDIESHGHLNRLKVAALLALLDRRTDITWEDWLLANMVWANSCAIWDVVLQYNRQKAAGAQRAKTRAKAAEAAEVKQSSEAVERIAERLRRYVEKHAGDAGCSRRDLKQAITNRYRDLFDAGLLAALNHGRLLERGRRYYPGQDEGLTIQHEERP